MNKKTKRAIDAFATGKPVQKPAPRIAPKEKKTQEQPSKKSK